MAVIVIMGMSLGGCAIKIPYSYVPNIPDKDFARDQWQCRNDIEGSMVLYNEISAIEAELIKQNPKNLEVSGWATIYVEHQPFWQTKKDRLKIMLLYYPCQASKPSLEKLQLDDQCFCPGDTI